MKFTVAPRGTALPPSAPQRPKPAPIGKTWRAWTSPGVYEAVAAVTAGGEWLFARAGDGTWNAVHLPAKTVVKTGLRSLAACRSYAGSGRAGDDLKKILELGETWKSA